MGGRGGAEGRRPVGSLPPRAPRPGARPRRRLHVPARSSRAAGAGPGGGAMRAVQCAAPPPAPTRKEAAGARCFPPSPQAAEGTRTRRLRRPVGPWVPGSGSSPARPRRRTRAGAWPLRTAGGCTAGGSGLREQESVRVAFPSRGGVRLGVPPGGFTLPRLARLQQRGETKRPFYDVKHNMGSALMFLKPLLHRGVLLKE